MVWHGMAGWGEGEVTVTFDDGNISKLHQHRPQGQPSNI